MTEQRSPQHRALSSFFLPLLLVLGCAAKKIPEAKTVVKDYVRAVDEGNADAVHALLTAKARRAISREEVAKMLRRDQKEFAEQARALSQESLVDEGRATLFLEGGRQLSLAIEEGQFRIHGGAFAPSRPRTPEEAAEELRLAIAARNFQAILSLLTDEGRGKLESAFERLDSSLVGLGTAVIDVRDDRATIELGDGQKIRLRQQDGAWRVEEIE